MLRHALKLVWNRRRSNRLVVIEIAAAFVITFVLTALAVNLWTNYRQPLGFEHENVWEVTVLNTGAAGGLLEMTTSDDLAGLHEDVLGALRGLPRAEAVAPIWNSAYGGANWRQNFRGDGGYSLSARANWISGEGLRTLGVKLLAGRAFGPEDEGQDYTAVVVNQTFVEAAFSPDTDPIGRRIDEPPGEALEAEETDGQAVEAWEIRIVGVIEEFRQDGEFAESVPYVIFNFDPSRLMEQAFNLLVKVAPGTDAGFEERIVETVESVAPGWVAQVVSWGERRDEAIANIVQPLMAAATVAAFFIVLVVMGLIGVLWQDVVRRTQELGLRRALGAAAGSVRRQIQLEMLVVGALGVLIGAVIAVQFPLLELLERIDWASALPALAFSAVLIMLLVALGALYPSWLASRREPADALRYE